MSNKLRWANIIVDAKKRPIMLIVTDGEWRTEIPVKNSRLATVRRAARDVYDVPRKHVFVTIILGDVSDDPDTKTC